MSFLDILAYLLVIVGGINWGLVGFFNYNLVTRIFGESTSVTRIIYAAIGLAAIYLLYSFMRVNRPDKDKT
ncbi:MAG TPA: DUF378 domain-containing protein [Candidatus Pristimantibacillus sp.]|nr:DUF378 domain-containing protein [Candidatus Pristimantibacillus sp.]